MAYGRAAYWDPFASPSGGYLPNRLTLPQAGLRVDWKVSPLDSLTFERGSYDGRVRTTAYLSTVPMTFLMKGSNAQVEWKHRFSDRFTSEALLSDWYTHNAVPGESRTTCNAQTQEVSPRSLRSPCGLCG